LINFGYCKEEKEMSHKKSDMETLLKMRIDLAKVQVMEPIEELSDEEPLTPRELQPQNPPPVLFKSRKLEKTWKGIPSPERPATADDLTVKKQVVNIWDFRLSSAKEPLGSKRRNSF
jgi:hypothetical protein